MHAPWQQLTPLITPSLPHSAGRQQPLHIGQINSSTRHVLDACVCLAAVSVFRRSGFAPSVLHTLHDALPLVLCDAAFHSRLDTICGKYELWVLLGIGALIISSCFRVLAQHAVLHLTAGAAHTPDRAGTYRVPPDACDNLHSYHQLLGSEFGHQDKVGSKCSLPAFISRHVSCASSLYIVQSCTCAWAPSGLFDS